MNVIIFTWSGSWGGGFIIFKNRVKFIQDGQRHRRQVTSSVFDYNRGGGGFLDTYHSRWSKNIHMHFIFLMTVVIQPLSICQNKLDPSFFSLISIYNSAEAIVCISQVFYYYRVEI